MKKLLYLFLLPSILFSQTTPSVTPRVDGEGSLGTETYRWGEGHFDELKVQKTATETDDVVNLSTATSLLTGTLDLVTSVAGRTGEVTLDADDVAETATKMWLSDVDKAKLGLITNVSAYGAVGDGVTDDTVALQSAIDAGGTVIFEAGKTYLITQLTVADRAVLIGNGATLLNTENRQNYPLVIIADDTIVYDLNIHIETTSATEHGSGIVIGADSVTIDRVYIYADHQDCGYLNGGSFAVWVNAGSDDIVLRDIRVHNFAYGLRFYGLSTSEITYRALVDNFKMSGSNVIGVFIGNLRNSKLNNISIEGLSSLYNTISAANTAGKNGILISSSIGIENLSFSNISISDTIEHCIRIGGIGSYARGILFSNISTKNAGSASSIGGGVGFKLGGDTQTPAYNISDIVISGFVYENTHTDTGGVGMNFYRCDGVTISDVVISGLADKRITYGVSFDGAKNIRFSNAIISNTSTCGLFVYGYYSAGGDFGTNENIVISDVSINYGGNYAVWFYTNATAVNTKEIRNITITDIVVNDTTYSYGNSLNAYCTLTDAHIDRWRLKNTSHISGTTIARGTFRQRWSNAAPATGGWSLGEIVYNSEPSSGEYIGWICTTAGSPGTWKGFGVIEP